MDESSSRRQPGSFGAVIVLLAVVCISSFFVGSEAFASHSICSVTTRGSHHATNWPTRTINSHSRPGRQNVELQLSSNQFDISKPVFDILSLKSVRGDAIVRYDSLNQSEPLRINIFGIMTLVFLAAPSLNEALGGDEMGLIGIVVSALFSAASLGLFIRECQRRSQQLNRFEKELNAEYLEVRLPTNALADMPFTKAVSLGELRKTSTSPRILALCGNASQLQKAMVLLNVLRRRLLQSSTFVVPVPTDGSTAADWKLDSTKSQWLAEPSRDLSSWQSYFDDLSANANRGDFRWFGLNSNGRSFGSGSGEVPQWLEVMGQHLRPTDFLDVDDKGLPTSNDDVVGVLDAQRSFYRALTGGEVDDMGKILSSLSSSQVSEVIESGGRVDDWNACLAEGARPNGMRTSGCDAVIVNENEAFSTCVEFPADTGIDDATLLAVQKWAKEDNAWKLRLHQTIPWSSEAKAQGTLRCDCRGCVALTRGKERRTFGGLIG